MSAKEASSEKEKIQARIKKMQDRLKALEARERAKEEKRLAKAKDGVWKVLVDLGLAEVPPAKLKSFLQEVKAAERLSGTEGKTAQGQE